MSDHPLCLYLFIFIVYIFDVIYVTPLFCSTPLSVSSSDESLTSRALNSSELLLPVVDSVLTTPTSRLFRVLFPSFLVF